jgi:phenylalanine ammonia-lyase
MPLSYLAGALEGSPDIYVTVDYGHTERVMTAEEALREAGIKPQVLGPRSGLGVVNGTAASVAAAGLAMFDAANLTAAATALTSLICEGMAARAEWLHPFVCEQVRPHPGQAEAGRIMRKFLKNSSLVSGLVTADPAVGCHDRLSLPTRASGGLAQDRYALRTAPQWLGPQFEDLLLAYSQLNIELNSTSDNPVTDARPGGGVFHSGNFQAAAVTSAVEKIRTSMCMVGKMLFSQCTEMLNYQMSGGLPPNLAADDPTVSFCLKGLDINIAAYQSELSFLANTISNHVQSAEMHNQAINSLAFLATRYTMQALEVLSLMVASVTFAACQAADLRVLHTTFLQTYTPMLAVSGTALVSNGYKVDALKARTDKAQSAMRNAWCK